jgi:hypothetical protein
MSIPGIPSQVSSWLLALFLTLGLELPLYAFLCRKDTTMQRALATGAMATLITHPLLWFIWQPTMKSLFHNAPAVTPAGEFIVVLVEAAVLKIMIRTLHVKTALSISLIANATSYGVGLCLFYIRVL